MAQTVKESVTAAVNDGAKPDAPSSTVNYYDGIISAYEREFKKWETRAEKVVKRYRDEQRAKQDNDHTKFNILWSNVQTLIPAVYSRVPQADVSRRFRDQDPAGRVAALILERALDYEINQYKDYRQTMKQCVRDRFLPGRGTAWARYEPHFKAAATQLPEDGLEVTEDVDDAPTEEMDYECSPLDYVHWKDFGHNVARTWEEVFCVWRAVYMTRAACIERFGEDKGKRIPLDTKPEEKKSNWSEDDRQYRALVYEIWDKEEGKAFWLSKSMKEMLDERDDPLGLHDFFPCPKPLFATITNETLIPVPDFTLYQDQAIELDTLSDRIDGLVRMLQVKGTYDGAIPELARLFTEGVSGTLVAVKNYAAYAEKRGLAGGTDIFDLKPIYEALRVAFEAVAALKEHIYEITGISDIVRGQTQASETLGAQQIKQNFVGLRLRSMQTEVAQFATEALQLKAQIICGKYTPQTIARIASVDQLSPADQQVLPQAMALLVGPERLTDPEADAGPNPVRAFRIEVNADTLVQIDEQGERESIQNLMQGMGTFMQQAGQVILQAPPLVPFFLEFLKWSLSKYRAGKTLEGTLDAAIEEIKQAAMAPKPPPPPDPKIVEAQTRAQADIQIAQGETQIKDQQHMREIAAKDQMHQREMAMKDQQHQREMQLKMQEAQMTTQADMQKHQMTVQAQSEQADKNIAAEKDRHAVEVEAKTRPQQVMQLDPKVEEQINGMAQTQQQQALALGELAQKLTQAMQALQQAATQLSHASVAPREHVVTQRDQRGKIARTISRVVT